MSDDYTKHMKYRLIDTVTSTGAGWFMTSADANTAAALKNMRHQGRRYEVFITAAGFEDRQRRLDAVRGIKPSANAEQREPTYNGKRKARSMQDVQDRMWEIKEAAYLRQQRMLSEHLERQARNRAMKRQEKG